MLECAAGVDQALLLRCRRGLGDPQRRDGRFGDLPGMPPGEGVLARFGDSTLHGAKLVIMTFRLSLDGAPAGMQQQCLGAADMLAEAAIALRLARLLLQRLELRLDRRDDVVEPQQIVFGSLEPQFGLVAARMKPGGAGSLFEKKPALRRLSFDQRTYSPLTDHRPRM